MATSLRDLRRKIRSIRSTQKMTSAMQLVAASKMQRAIRRAIESREYANRLRSLIDSIAQTVDPSGEPLFKSSESDTVLVILLTSNRGLAGSLNTQLMRLLASWQLEEINRGKRIEVVAVGAKGRHYLMRYARQSLLADFPAPDTVPTFTDATPVAQIAIDEFSSGRIERVYLAYNHFASTLKQEPRIIQYLPFTTERGEGSANITDVIFEPNQAAVLEALIPRVLRSQLYQTFLEAHASEQSARMLAMKNATDNAGDLVDDLSLTYNSYRQAAITGELLDIAGGAAALEN